VANSFRKALKHLKSTQITEQPTNSMSKVYAINPPGYDNRAPDKVTTFVPDVDGNWPEGIPGTPGEVNYKRPEGVWQGGSNWDRFSNADLSQDTIGEDGKSTEGLIEPDGTVKTMLPPDSRHFILGPLTDGFTLNHVGDAYTNIGYLQKDTRQFVLLGRIPGQMKSDLHSDNSGVPIWDGTSNGFIAYNSSFTLEMAQWFRTEILASRYLSHVPYYYSGGVPQTPQSPADCPTCPEGMKGGNTVGGGGDGGSAKDGSGGGGWGSGGTPNIGTKQGPSNQGDAEDAGYDGSWNQAFFGGGGKKPKGPATEKTHRGALDATKASTGMYDDMTPEKFKEKYGMSYDEYMNLPQAGYGSSSGSLPDGTQVAANQGPSTPVKYYPGMGYAPNLGGGRPGNVRPKGGAAFPQAKVTNQTTYVSHYEPQGKVLKESFSKRHVKLIKERKKEFKVPELPKKYKMNFAGKYSSQNTPDVTASKKSDELVASGNAKGQRWRAEDKYWQGYETTERMNVIYDRVGHGEQAWERVIGEARRQNAWKNREIQEQLNIIEHEKAHRKIYENYESPWGTVIHEGNQDDPVNISTLKDPLLKKVQKRLKKEIEYDDRPATKGYPNDPPPEMVNGWHPKLGKKMPYKKLDPESAKMMPNTGDPDIDVNIEKARKKPK